MIEKTKTWIVEFSFFSVLFIVLMLTILLSSCSSSRPSDSDIRKAIEEKIEQEGKGFVKIVNFKKTDGVEMEVYGVRYYDVDFEAVVECLTDCYYRSGDIDEILIEKENFMLFGSPYYAACMRGQQITFKGLKMRLILTEKGWHRR